MKLIDILREIGEKEYGYEPTEVSSSNDRAQYEFDTDSGTPYAVSIVKWKGEAPDRKSWSFDVLFGKREEYEDEKGNRKTHVDTEVEVNDPKNLYKVMGAVMKAVKSEIAKTEETSGRRVKQLTMNPTRRKVKGPTGAEAEDPTDERRKNLYLKYIQNQFKGSRVESGGDYITVDLT